MEAVSFSRLSFQSFFGFFAEMVQTTVELVGSRLRMLGSKPGQWDRKDLLSREEKEIKERR